MELDVKLKPVLTKIDFVNRYQKLSDKFQTDESSFSNYNDSTVKEIIESYGYKVKFNKSEKFFKILEKENDYKFQFNIVLKYGIVELIWDVLENNQRLSLGGPWGLITKLYMKNEVSIPLPKFCNYMDLKEILIDAFRIYEDFKHQLIKEHGIDYKVREISSTSESSLEIVDIKKLKDERIIICSGSNEKKLYTESHDIQVESQKVSFLINDTLPLNNLSKEVSQTFFYQIIEETNASKNIFDGFDSIDGFTLRYLIKNKLLIVISSGETQPHLFKLFVEGIWKVEYKNPLAT